jgi:hypothetical protein
LLPERRRILLAGMVAGVPGQGGATWAVLQWVLGLRQLGHDVLLVEPVDALTPHRVGYFERLAARFGLGGRAALVTPEHATAGPGFGDLAAFASTCDLVLNASGLLREPDLLGPAPARAYLDLDPAFTQLWHEVDGVDMGLDGHTHHVTVGLNVGQPGCPVPTAGRTWVTTVPVVALDHWPAARITTGGAWTTVANWRGYGNAEHDGVRHGQKAHAWRTLLAIPSLTAARIAPAVAIHADEVRDLERLEAGGWGLLDPARVAGDPDRYQSFVSGSLGELGIAKEGYVVSRSGWFSDRSACYLAAGRPVVAQETGWSAHLPTGDGLHAFTTAEEAAAAIDATTGRYRHACRSARAIAAEVLDARRALPPLLEELT